MKMNKYALYIILTFVCYSFFYSNSNAQQISYYNNETYNPFSKTIYKPGTNFHTSVKPYSINKISQLTNVDSLIYDGMKMPLGNENFWKRIFKDHLLKWENKDVSIRINPLFNLEAGKENEEGQNTWTNTRGFFIEGNIGKHFYFYTDVLENQAVFPNYYDSFVQDRKVVPGQGKTRNLGERTHDYAQSTGYISFNPAQWFNIQLGQGKNFIGDGHRSLLLSDVSYSYPYLKFSAEFNKAHYMVMWGQHRDLNIDSKLESNDARYLDKYSATHYLTINVGNRLSVGLFESVIWAAQDTMGQRNFDWAYLNPIIFYRPVEYSIGSPDNMTMGANLKYTIGKHNVLYGQFVMGEFKMDEVFSGNKWWANKQGFQLGLKCFDLFAIKNLYFQTEYNQVRPYTYSHREVITNYGHYNQELAHPLGANFRESVSFLRYKTKRWLFSAELMYAMYGKDFDDEVSYGGNIYQNNNKRPGDYNHEIGQGLKTNLIYLDASISYLINPRNNFNIAVGSRLRKEKNDLEENNTQMLWFALRTSIKSLYTDF
ncbi:hypothetical protein [Plebeiibacterium marinum]|uniref:Gliding motility protein RemB n=1 Tax=Plebeiibacterium marinum TaxID=2992111 RepID=A0AAE3MHG9_9BACT|nr:hypothetical protein [Plebeiobacterium marinum]MCW3807696.1 hypothetical protein [Plebeiobacterium marinum]